MDIFNPKFVRRPDPALFKARRGARHPTLGHQVFSSFDFYGEAQVVIFGCAQDEGARRSGERAGAADAPAAIRRALYEMGVMGLQKLSVLDLGDVALQPQLEQTQGLMQQWVQRLMEDGKRVIVLGGGNDVLYPACSALSYAAPAMLAFNVNAQFDAREEAAPSSATPWRQLMNENCLRPEMLYCMGYQPYAVSPQEESALRTAGVNLCSAPALRELGVLPTFKRVLRKKSMDVLAWALDLDVVNAAEAPGVSQPNPTGLSALDLCEISALAGSEARTRLLAVTGVNPVFDVDQRTSRLAATAIWHYLAALAAGRK